MSNSLVYCFTSAFFGWDRICTSESLSRLVTDATTGRRPMNSGIRPNLIRSSGMTSAKWSWVSISALECTSAPNPSPRLPTRSETIFSRPANAPATMNSTLVVSIWINSWWGCLRPPCGGTEAWVPSRIFSSACCTPSPETSRVIDGFSLLRAILSTSSM